MSIKFITDNFKSNDLNELNSIINSLKINPIKNDRKADFLRRFTLAVINTFKAEKTYSPEIHDVKIDAGNIHAEPNIKRLNIIGPPKKLDVPFELFLRAPRKITLPKELLEEAPDKELNVNAPYKD